MTTATSIWARIPPWRDLLGRRSHVWALADQAVVSLGSFVSTLVAARALAPNEYGQFALLFGVILFLSGLQSALVCYPLSVRAAHRIDADSTALLTSDSLGITLVLCLPLSLLLVPTCLIIGRSDAIPLAMLAFLALVLQQTTRYAFMAQLSLGRSIAGDAISYLGQAAMLVLVLHFFTLHLQTVFLVMALTSCVAVMVQSIQLRVRMPRSRRMLNVWAEFWELGRWNVLSSFLSVFLVQLFPWALALFWNQYSTAQLASTINVLGVAHPLIFGLMSIITPAVAHRRRAGTDISWVKMNTRFSLYGLVLMGPYLLLLVLWPELVLRLFYGGASPYRGLTAEVRILAAAYLFVFLGSVTVAVLGGLEEAKSTALVQLIAAITALTLGLGLTAVYGLVGACIGIALVNFMRLAAASFYLKRTTATESSIQLGGSDGTRKLRGSLTA